MVRLRNIWILSLSALLFGCGSNPSGSIANNTPPPPPPAAPALNGNWNIQAASQNSGQSYLLGGNLITSGSAVSGTLHSVNWSCFLINQTTVEDIPVTGTISSTGALTLSNQSAPVMGQVLKLSGTYSASNIASGTFAVSGGCGGGEKGTITGFSVPSMNGTYKGVFLSVSGVQISTDISVAQTGPNTHGEFGLNGSATFSGSPCFTSGPIATSLVIGSFVQVQITTGNGLVLFQGTVDSTGKTITGQYSITGGSCANDSGSGTVSLS